MGDPRLFVAIPLSGAALDHLTALLKEVRTLPEVRWSRADQLHLTFLFMGPTPEEKIPALTTALKGLAVRHKAFELSLAGWDAFPNLSSPKVLFAKVGGKTEALGALVLDVRRSVGSRMDPQEGAAHFQAHITLGRMREKKDHGPAVRSLEKEKDRLTGPFPADRLVLFESVLGSGRARYIERASFSLPG